VRLRGERDLLSASGRVTAPARSGALLVLGGAVLWGTSGSSQELLGGAVGPLVVGSLRTILGGAALGLVALFVARRESLSLTEVTAARSAARMPLLLAGLCIALYQVTFFVGVRSLGIAVGTILAIGATPFFAGAVSIALGQGRPSRAWFATTSLAVVGLALLIRPEEGVSVSPAGVAAALAAGLAFGTFTVLSKAMLELGLRRLDTVVIPFLIAGALLLPVLVVGLAGAEDPGAIVRVPGLLVVLWLALGATAGGYLLFIAGLRGVTAVVGTTLVLAEPLTATLLGILVFAERLSLSASTGALLVAVALLLTARRPEPVPAR
jgi:DME family drug/metabolite transporter